MGGTRTASPSSNRPKRTRPRALAAERRALAASPVRLAYLFAVRRSRRSRGPLHPVSARASGPPTAATVAAPGAVRGSLRGVPAARRRARGRAGARGARGVPPVRTRCKRDRETGGWGRGRGPRSCRFPGRGRDRGNRLRDPGPGGDRGHGRRRHPVPRAGTDTYDTRLDHLRRPGGPQPPRDGIAAVGTCYGLGAPRPEVIGPGPGRGPDRDGVADRQERADGGDRLDRTGDTGHRTRFIGIGARSD